MTQGRKEMMEVGVRCWSAVLGVVVRLDDGHNFERIYLGVFSYLANEEQISLNILLGGYRWGFGVGCEKTTCLLATELKLKVEMLKVYT